MSSPNRQPVKKLSFGGRTRFAARRPFLCPPADRLPDGPGLGQSVVLRLQVSPTRIDGASLTQIRAGKTIAYYMSRLPSHSCIGFSVMPTIATPYTAAFP